MPNTKSTTNNNLRDLIDNRIESLRLEMKSDIKELSGKVDALATKQAVSSTKIGMLIAAITIVVSAVTSTIVNTVRSR